MNPSSSKAQRALATLRRRLETEESNPRKSRGNRQPKCVVRLDRLVVVSSGFPFGEVAKIPGFRRTQGRWLRPRRPEEFLRYGRISRFTSTTTIQQMTVLSQRRSERVPNYRITMTARDRSGLAFQDVCAVFELLPDVRLRLVELAWDFTPESRIDGFYLREHILAGKSRPRRVAEIRNYDSYGSRRGGQKFVRSYYKVEIEMRRLELEIGSRLLHRLDITDIFDFHKLAKLLPHHLVFARIDRRRVIQRLKKSGNSAAETKRVLDAVDDHWLSLHAQLAVLRRNGGMTNVRRVLEMLPDNDLLRRALQRWLIRWPKSPARVEKRGPDAKR